MTLSRMLKQIILTISHTGGHDDDGNWLSMTIGVICFIVLVLVVGFVFITTIFYVHNKREHVIHTTSTHV